LNTKRLHRPNTSSINNNNNNKGDDSRSKPSGNQPGCDSVLAAFVKMWPQNLPDAWLLTLPTLVPYMILMSLKMMERQTPFTSETFLPEYDYIVGK
jgi:ureidoglycolate hydrolase